MSGSSNRFPIPLELIEHLNRGDCVLFAGDALEGGSQSARLAQALVDAAHLHAGCPLPGCRDHQRCQKPGRCAVSLAHAAQLYEARTNRQTLLDFVLRCLETTPPGPLHRALAELQARVMISTAYDDRLYEALRQSGRPTLQVVKDTDIPFDDPNRVQLIRLHGTASQPESLLLTEDDQADLFARLPLVTKILQAHFATKTLLFIGYSLNDPHFLALYHQVTGPIARYARLAYAVQWPPDPLAAERWQGKITMLPEEPLDFLKRLAGEVRIEVLHRQQEALPPEPYKFLDYYTEEDAAIFFGRDLETDLLLSAILAQRLSVFYGRSGTGKISLLRARVLPRLKAAGWDLGEAGKPERTKLRPKFLLSGQPTGKKRRYPWGAEFDLDKCNTAESGIGTTTPVGQCSARGGDSPYGAADMAGNVWEWCGNLYIPYPYKPEDGREISEGTGDRVLRGGSFSSLQGSARCSSRNDYYPDGRDDNFGFRVGLSPIRSEL